MDEEPIPLEDNEDLVQEPSLEWDCDEETISPYFMHDEAFLHSPGKYPENVETGRVYNFDNLPPLPLSITSPPDLRLQPVSSTPLDWRKPKTKNKKKVIKKLSKFFQH